jgi:D-threonate/D-erythronate kinase
MLRGNPLADLEGVLQVTDGTCLVAPALPAESRVTAAGVQHWPGGEADLRLLLRPLGERVRLCDAGSDEDLLAIAQGVVARGDRLLAGTAGLAAALASALGLPDPPAPAGLKCSRPLAVVGSPAARRQATFAADRGWQVKILPPGELPVVDPYDGLVLTGGETAARVLKAHGARGLELVGQALPRTPACRVRGGRLDGLPVVLKAGAFGESDALHRALEVLSGRAA